MSRRWMPFWRKSTALETNDPRACLLSLFPGETTSMIATIVPYSCRIEMRLALRA